VTLTPEQRHGARLLADELNRLRVAYIEVMQFHLGAMEIADFHKIPLEPFTVDLSGIDAEIARACALLNDRCAGAGVEAAPAPAVAA
jgi:hypothetical protein